MAFFVQSVRILHRAAEGLGAVRQSMVTLYLAPLTPVIYVLLDNNRSCA